MHVRINQARQHHSPSQINHLRPRALHDRPARPLGRARGPGLRWHPDAGEAARRTLGRYVHADDRLRARGLQTSNRTVKLFDYSAGIGGPIKKDKIWYFGTYREQFNAVQQPLFAFDKTFDTKLWNAVGKTTYQVNQKNKLIGYYQWGQKIQPNRTQGGVTVTHESGLYVGTWGSSIGFNNGTEIDVIAGFAKEVSSGLTADIGATVYLYPGSSNTTVIEPYFAMTGTVGPATIKGMVAWAPGGQDSLADNSAIYLSGDVGVAVPSTPFKLKGHVGYSKSDSFLGGLDGDVTVGL